MPKPRYLKSFGIVIFLVAAGCAIWSSEEIARWKPTFASSAAISHSQGDFPRQKKDVGSARRATRELNAASRVRSLLQIAPGEVGNIRIPSSGLDSLLSDEQKQNYANMLLTPITREQAIQGLEEILRHGNSLNSRVEVCNGKITWKEDGIEINGEVLESRDDLRNLNVVMEGADANEFPWKQRMSVGFQGYSFLLARAPDPDVTRENCEKGSVGKPCLGSIGLRCNPRI